MKSIFNRLPLGYALALPFIIQVASVPTYQDPVSASRLDVPDINQQASSLNVIPTILFDTTPTTGTPNTASFPTARGVPQIPAPEFKRDVHPSISKYLGINTALDSKTQTSPSTETRTKASSRPASPTQKPKPTKSRKPKPRKSREPFFDNHMVPPYAWAYENRVKHKAVSTKTSDTVPSKSTPTPTPTEKHKDRQMPPLHPPSRQFLVAGITIPYPAKAVDITSSANVPESTPKST